MIRSRKPKKARQYSGQQKKTKARQYSGQQKKDKGQTIQWPIEKRQRTNNDLQNTTQKTKDRVTRTLLKYCVSLMDSVPVFTSRNSDVLKVDMMDEYYIF